jgi:hypothetical protein
LIAFPHAVGDQTPRSHRGEPNGFAQRGAMRPLCARRRALPLPDDARTAGRDGPLAARERARRPRRRAGRACAPRLRRVEARPVPAGRSGVPARHFRPGTTRRPGAERTDCVTCRRGSYRSAAPTAHSCAVGRSVQGCTLADGARPAVRRSKQRT